MFRWYLTWLYLRWYPNTFSSLFRLWVGPWTIHSITCQSRRDRADRLRRALFHSRRTLLVFLFIPARNRSIVACESDYFCRTIINEICNSKSCLFLISLLGQSDEKKMRLFGAARRVISIRKTVKFLVTVSVVSIIRLLMNLSIVDEVILPLKHYVAGTNLIANRLGIFKYFSVEECPLVSPRLSKCIAIYIPSILNEGWIHFQSCLITFFKS